MEKRPVDYKECNCTKCKHAEDCPHKGAYRRMPREIGGLGLCKNLHK